jgi:hypothetical protein
MGNLGIVTGPAKPVKHERAAPGEKPYVKALRPVIASPRMRVWISLVPS